MSYFEKPEKKEQFNESKEIKISSKPIIIVKREKFNESQERTVSIVRNDQNKKE